MKREGRIFSEMLRPSPQVLVQHGYCCKQGRTLLASAAVCYQLRLWAGQTSLGFCLLSYTFISLFSSGWGQTQQ